MARPVDHQKRKDIVDVAHSWAVSHGADQVSMAALAKATGIKRSTLYWYFPSLNQLLLAIVKRSYDELINYVVKQVADIEHPIDQLYETARAISAFAVEREDDIRMLVQLLGQCNPNTPDAATAIGIDVMGRGRLMLQRSVEAGIDAGQVVPCNAEEIIEYVRVFINGVLTTRLAGGTAPERLYQLLWQTLLEPLKTQPHEKESP